MNTFFEKKVMADLIQRAACFIGKTGANPVAGAAIVQHDRILSEGFHSRFGSKHAEIIAIENCKTSMQNATLLVTLEPCTHFGKTPPCAGAIRKAGIKRVIYSVNDPFLVAQQLPRAVDVLKPMGIEVISGLHRKKGILLNEIFFKNIILKKPFFILKAASTLDGKIALKTGESKYITGPAALESVHQLRNQTDAILIGINTLLADDPSLTIRLKDDPDFDQSQKTIIILDSKLRTPPTAKLFSYPHHVIIVTDSKNKNCPFTPPPHSKVTIWPMNTTAPEFWETLSHQLFSIGIKSVLIEGGSEVFASAIKNAVIDKVCLYYAPKFILGKSSLSMTGGIGVQSLKDAINVKDIKTKRLKNDILITGYICHPLDWFN